MWDIVASIALIFTVTFSLFYFIRSRIINNKDVEEEELYDESSSSESESESEEIDEKKLEDDSVSGRKEGKKEGKKEENEETKKRDEDSVKKMKKSMEQMKGLLNGEIFNIKKAEDFVEGVNSAFETLGLGKNMVKIDKDATKDVLKDINKAMGTMMSNLSSNKILKNFKTAMEELDKESDDDSIKRESSTEITKVSEVSEVSEATKEETAKKEVDEDEEFISKMSELKNRKLAIKDKTKLDESFVNLIED